MIVIPIFILLIFFYFHNVLSSSYIFVERDLSAFFIPPRYLWVNLLRSFELPLWNPYSSSGIPLLATLQPGILYPPHILYLFLPFNIVWNWMIILHFVFSGVTINVFLRYLKASALASFVGGAVFMLSGYLLSIHNILPHLLAVPWFPLVVMSFLKYLEGRQVKHIVLTGIFVTTEFLAGAPEIVMITFLVLVVVSIFPGVFINEKVDAPLRFKAIILIGVIFLLLSAVQLLPFYELKAWSIRRSGLSYKEATLWSFAWKDYLQFFLPDVFGYSMTIEKYFTNQSWLKTVYLGIIPFILSIFFFLSKDRKRWLFLALIVASFLIAMGKYTPLYTFLYYIPPFNSIRYPVKFLFPFFFVISVTSALGFDRLQAGLEQKDRKTKSIIYGAFYSSFFFAVLWGYLYLFDADVYRFLDVNGFKPEEYNDIQFNLHNLKRFLLFSFMFCVMLLVTLRVRFKKITLCAIVCILTLDLFLANYSFYFSVPWQWYISKRGFVENLLKSRATERYMVTMKTYEEIQSINEEKTIAAPPYAPFFGMYSILGVEIMRIMHHEMFLGMLVTTASISNAKKYFDMSGVRYVITSYKVDDKDFTLVKNADLVNKTAYLYEYTKYPGRFLLYSKATFAKDDREVIEKLQSNEFDSRNELILLKPHGVNPTSPSPRPSPARGEGKLSQPHGVNPTSPSPRPSPARGEGKLLPSASPTRGEGYGGCSSGKDLQGRVKLLSYKANRFDLEYESDGDAFLYVSDTYYPGWRAYVDGKETEIYRANLAFRAIEAPKGKHTVVFKYVPMSFYIGLALTIIGILLCVWLWRRDKAAESKELRAHDKF